MHSAPMVVVTQVPRVERPLPKATEIAVVVPCHNYARFLFECLASLHDQTLPPSQIIVVDDASDDHPESICSQFKGVQYVRCDVRDVHEARAIGLQQVTTRNVCFLDADDKLPPEYLAESMSIFRQSRNVAITFPVLQYFGDRTGPAHGTDHAKQELTSDDLEQRNWISAGCVIRTELLHQSLAFKRGKIDGKKCWTQDWLVAKAVLRSGSWVARQMRTPLLYRKHGSNMSSAPIDDYWCQADLGNETITLIIAFSGRWDCWARLSEWLHAQTWPVSQLRLLIVNGTHKPLSPKMLGLENWGGSMQISRMDAGIPGLGDLDRRDAPGVQQAVEAAVAGIYNHAVSIAGTEYLLFLEDDIVPHRPDCIRTLLKSMGAWVSAVSGVYRARYQTESCAAFRLPYRSAEDFFPLEASGEAVDIAGGSGFGCLLTRRSLLRRFPLGGSSESQWYDVQHSISVSTADGGQWRWLLHRGVRCGHHAEDGIRSD